jgi:hypothetical protein
MYLATAVVSVSGRLSVILRAPLLCGLSDSKPSDSKDARPVGAPFVASRIAFNSLSGWLIGVRA